MQRCLDFLWSLFQYFPHIKFCCVRLCAHVSISFGLLQRDFAILHCISCITIAQQWLWYQSWWMTMMMHFANVAWNVIHCLRTDCYWWGQLTLIIMKLWSQKNIILHMFYFEFIINNNHTVFSGDLRKTPMGWVWGNWLGKSFPN